MRIPNKIVQFFHEQNFIVVSTVDKDGMPHNSCKGLVKIDSNGFLYLLDLYHGKTYANLKHNSSMSITAIDEHGFLGYCLKGYGKIVDKKELNSEVIERWNKRLNSRIIRRIVKNVRGKRGHIAHPEARLPRPKYLIEMQVKKIVSLSPKHLNNLKLRR
jgi:predicted pyridoxine 5'-phosphate oxidase superfamily flavin-nucleotide-binding protein